MIIYCPKPNPFLRPPTFCSPLSHPLPPPPTTPKRNINKKDNERMNASMQETVDPGEPRQVSCEVKSHNHPKTSAMKCSPSLYNQSSCIFCLGRLLCTNGFCHAPLTHFSGAVPGLHCGLVHTAECCSCLRTRHGITVLKIVNVKGARLLKIPSTGN